MQPHVDTHVAVAIGNTTIQLATFSIRGRQAGELRHIAKSPARADGFLEYLERLTNERCAWHVASVFREAEHRLARLIAQRRTQDTYCLLSHAAMPLAVQVEQPERVGLDRLAAAVAANQLRRSGCPVIVVDVGTAVTVNLLDAAGAFRGGAILPGFTMAAGALTAQTDLLPLVPVSPQDDPPPALGTSTEKAIRSGLFWGIVGAVREIAERLTDSSTDIEIFVTGGGGHHLARLLGPTARYVPDLVLMGIAASAARHFVGAEL